MAGVPDDGLVKAGPWPAGVNNLAKEGLLPEGALREADNIDLDKAGYAGRRVGYLRSYAGTLVHSLWSHDHLDFGLFVDSGQLHAIRADESVEALGITVGDQPLSYALINDRVFWSNAVACGLLTLDLQAWEWAAQQPDGQPDAAPEPGYGLHPGQYQVAITYTDALGRESGSTLAVVVDVPEGHGIRLASIPMPADLTATPITNIYLTDANDQVLRLHSSQPSGMSIAVIGQQAKGRAISTQLLRAMPAGHIVRSGSGRQFVARLREVLWSPSLRYGMLDPARNRIRYPDAIDMMEPVGSGTPGAGVFVAAGKRTVWLGGADPQAFTQTIAHSSGVVPGSSMTVSAAVLGLERSDDVLVWLARNGHFCVGLPGGQVMQLKLGEAVVNDASRAAVMFREHDGLQQLVAALRGSRKQGLAIADKLVAHVIHEDP